MTIKYKVTAEGNFDKISQVIPAIAFIGHDRSKIIKATIIIEEIENDN